MLSRISDAWNNLFDRSDDPLGNRRSQQRSNEASRYMQSARAGTSPSSRGSASRPRPQVSRQASFNAGAQAAQGNMLADRIREGRFNRDALNTVQNHVATRPTPPQAPTTFTAPPPPSAQQQAPPPVPQYPTTPPPLTAQQLAELNRQRREATRRVGEAEAELEHGTSEADTWLTRARRDLARDVGSAERQARDHWGDRGLAHSPAFLGRDLREVRDEAAVERASLEEQRAARIGALERAVSQAEEERRRHLADLAEQEALLRTPTNRLVRSGG